MKERRGSLEIPRKPNLLSSLCMTSQLSRATLEVNSVLRSYHL